MSEQQQASVSVVVVTHNNEDTIERCLRSIDEGDHEVEVVVVDNASRDGSVEVARRARPSAQVVETGRNGGFATGCNIGVAASGGHYVLLLNPDAALLPGSLHELVQRARAHPDEGLYGGRVVDAQGRTDPSSCWGDMSLWSLLAFASLASTVFTRNRLLDPESLGRWERDTVRHVPVITGCLLLAERSTWDALQGMDERFWLYGEDADFSLRARRAGHRPVVVPTAVALHDKGGSSPGGAKMALVLAGRATLIRARWSPVRASIGLLLLQIGTGVRAGLEVASRRRRRTWVRAWADRSTWRQGYPAARALVTATTTTEGG